MAQLFKQGFSVKTNGAGIVPANETSRIELLERDLYIMLQESKRDKKRIKELEAANERLNNHNKSLKAQISRIEKFMGDANF